MGRKCGALGEQEQEREGRATSWTSKSIVGGRATSYFANWLVFQVVDSFQFAGY
jgi:hypothetical protein